MKKINQIEGQDGMQSDRDGTSLQPSELNYLNRKIKNKAKIKSKNIKFIVVLIFLVFLIVVSAIKFLNLNQNKIEDSTEDKITQERERSESIINPQVVKPGQNPQKQVKIQQIKKIDEPKQVGDQFQVQKKFWLFDGSNPQGLLDQLYYQNNKYYAKKSGFEVHIVTKDNYLTFLSPQTARKVQQIQKIFNQKAKNDNPFLQKNRDAIYKASLILILADNGGIVLTDFYCLTQTFDWLKNIKNNIRAFQGLDHGQPQVFAFYNPDRSSPSVQQNIRVNYQVEKFMRIFPGLTRYFIASKKNSKFMQDIKSQIIQMLMNPDKLKEDAGQYNYNGLNINDVYSNHFELATQRILQRKQKYLDTQIKNQKYRTTALSFYGIYTITEYAAARKMFIMFGDQQNHVQFQSMIKYAAQDWAQLIGPFVQLTRFTPHHIMNGFLQEVIDGRRDPMIRGSLVQKLLYPESKQSFIIDDPQKYFVNTTSEAWVSLPKIIWVYWNSGIYNAPLDNQVCVEVMRIRGKESGFQLRILSDNNLKDYLNQTYIDKINAALTNPKVQTFPQSRGDLVRLAVLATHGGVYFDVSYLLLNNLDWLVNIGKYPSRYINNRYGHLPKVVMHYHPQWGGVFQFKVNTTINTKVQWQLPYQNNFIAAEKGNEFIVEWFQLLLSFYQKPYHQTSSYMQNFGLRDMWASHYLMPMDTLKCVIGRKQKQIREAKSSPWADASDYYKIWALNGYMGIQKYRDRTGYESHGNSDNTFVYRYSQPYVEGFLGKNFNLIKFYGQQNHHLSNLIAGNQQNNFTSSAHPQSILMRYLIHKDVPFYFEGGVKVKH